MATRSPDRSGRSTTSPTEREKRVAKARSNTLPSRSTMRWSPMLWHNFFRRGRFRSFTGSLMRNGPRHAFRDADLVNGERVVSRHHCSARPSRIAFLVCAFAACPPFCLFFRVWWSRCAPLHCRGCRFPSAPLSRLPPWPSGALPSCTPPAAPPILLYCDVVLWYVRTPP